MINYVIKRSNGQIFASIPNHTILGPNQPNQNPAPINLVGRDKVGYGQAWNENALWQSENFAGQLAPKGSIIGQIWYRYTSGTGELLISLVDNARQPDASQPDTELDWAAIPMITVFNTVPDGSNSIMGRMVLTNNGDSLKVLMKDKEWREIQTTRPQNKQFESLLDINYDTGTKYISFTQSTATRPVAYFNVGGASLVDNAGYTVFQNGDGVFQFGSNYFYELKIIAREVNLANGEVVSLPQNYKTWTIKGAWYVNNPSTYVPGTTPIDQVPDPRRVANLTQNIDTIDSTQDMWNVTVNINGVDINLPNPSGTTQADYENYVLASLNTNKHLGIRIDGNVSNLSVGQTTLTQWSVLLKVTGVPPIGV